MGVSRHLQPGRAQVPADDGSLAVWIDTTSCHARGLGNGGALSRRGCRGCPRSRNDRCGRVGRRRWRCRRRVLLCARGRCCRATAWSRCRCRLALLLHARGRRSRLGRGARRRAPRRGSRWRRDIGTRRATRTELLARPGDGWGARCDDLRLLAADELGPLVSGVDTEDGGALVARLRGEGEGENLLVLLRVRVGDLVRARKIVRHE